MEIENSNGKNQRKDAPVLAAESCRHQLRHRHSLDQRGCEHPNSTVTVE
jgi:hypothetical protein